MKRNEQGQYQRRFICTVPHLFLYYFDSDTSDAPRGIIDLELYTNISTNNNTLKLASIQEDRLRFTTHYYFHKWQFSVFNIN